MQLRKGFDIIIEPINSLTMMFSAPSGPGGSF